jgi:hypothetical protein
MGVTRWAANEVGGNHAVGCGVIGWRRLSLSAAARTIGRFCGSGMFAASTYPVVLAATKRSRRRPRDRASPTASTRRAAAT